MPPAPISASTIAAQAFRYMELGAISSFGDDTPEAADAAEQYPRALRLCLEAADWSFASTLAHLPAAELKDGEAEDVDLPWSYRIPGDLVRLHQVGDDWTAWRLDAASLLRADDPAPLRIRYTRLIENEAQMPAAFQNAVSLTLAVLLGPRWLKGEGKLERLERQAATQLKQAMRQDAGTASAQRYDDLGAQSDWVTEARR